MSVIEEALRRAQGPLHPSQPTKGSSAAPAQAPAQPAVYTPPQAPAGPVSPPAAHSWSPASAALSVRKTSSLPRLATVAVILGIAAALTGLTTVWLARRSVSADAPTPAAAPAVQAASTTTAPTPHRGPDAERDRHRGG